MNRERVERGSQGWPPTASQVREMLSGQTPSAMVAVPGGAMPHQVSGSGGAAALTLPAISLRRATAKQFVQWNVTLNNVIGWYNLTHVVEEGQPPSRAAIHGLYPDLDPEEVEDKYTDALRQYQEENTSLFYVCAPSISLDGEWHSIDLEYILDKFTRGTLRDGNGFLKWFRAKHDITTPEKQMALRAELQSNVKFDLNMGLTKMLKVLVDGLSLWCKIGDNDKHDVAKLDSYYKLILEKMPTKPPEANIVRVRVRLAEKVFANAPELAQVERVVEDLVNFGKALGMSDPTTQGRERDAILTVDGLPRLTAADNDCTFCDLWGCKAQTDIKACPCLNKAVKIGEGSSFPRDVQVRYITGARAHVAENPTLNSLKGVKFKVEPPKGGYTGGGRGKGRGRGSGQGGRGGGGRQATPLMEAPSSSIVDVFGDEGENSNDFDTWLTSQMHEEAQQVTPIFGGLFGNRDGDSPTITEAVRDAIEEATASAVDSAFASLTPASATSSADNPALRQIPPVTPVASSALSALRASKAEGGGETPSSTRSKSDGKRPDSNQSKKSESTGKKKKDDDDDKTGR